MRAAINNNQIERQPKVREQLISTTKLQMLPKIEEEYKNCWQIWKQGKVLKYMKIDTKSVELASGGRKCFRTHYYLIR